MSAYVSHGGLESHGSWLISSWEIANRARVANFPCLNTSVHNLACGSGLVWPWSLTLSLTCEFGNLWRLFRMNGNVAWAHKS